ncbi:MAG TPA: PAS domain S-box protein [Thermodesulfobacteriota bacterium]|nr:PAS domain S-box protein [Thermodesulfobacteriota bacterium]
MEAKDKTEGKKDSSPRHTEDKPSDSSSVRFTQDKPLDSSTKLKAQDIIRMRTKELLKGKSENLDELSTSDFQSLIQELRTYQVELEMQNEELRRTQSELEESRNKYTDLFDFAPIGYFMVDKTNRILEVNFTGGALLGTEKKHLIKKTFTRYIAREDQHMFYLYIKQLLDTKTKGTCELRMLKNNGATFHAQLEGVALFNIDGKFSHFRLAAHDITERKKAEEILKGAYEKKLRTEVNKRKHIEEALKQSEEEYRNLFDNIPTGVYRTSPSGRILMANRTLVEMLGYSSFEGLASLNLEEKGNFHPNYPRSQFKERIEREGEVKGLESLWEKRDGSFIFVRENAKAIWGEDGQVLYYEGTAEDITKQKLMEENSHKSFVLLSKKNLYEKITRTIIESVHKSINLQDILENAVDTMNKNVDKADIVSIYMVEGKEAVLKAHRGYPDWYIERAGRIPYPRGITWQSIIEGKPLYIADADQDTTLGPAGRDAGIQSCLSVPIHFEGETIGTLNIVSLQKNAFDEEELKLLETVGRQIEVAIRNAKQAEGLRKAKEELELRVVERAKELLEVNEKLRREVAWHQWAEKAIQTSEERFRALYDENPSMYLTVNGEGKVLSINQFGTEQLGYDSYELIGQSLFNIIYQGDREEAFGKLNKCFQNPGQSYSSELRLTRKDRRIFWAKQSTRAVQSPDGNLIALVVCEDITDRKIAEEELLETLKKLSKKSRYETIISTVTRAVHQSLNLQDVLENAVDAISKNIDLAEDACIYLVEGDIAAIKAHRNLPDWYIERAGKIYYPIGFTWKTIIEGKPIYCPDIEKDTAIGPAGRELGTKSYLSMPIRFEDRTVGALIMHSYEKDAFDEEELKLFEIVARQIEIAINNAKQAETSRESEERLKLALACADMGTWRWDLTTDTDYRGANMNRIMGLEPVESYEPGDKLMERIHTDDRPIAEEIFERIRQEGGDYLAEFRIIRPDGTTTWLRNQGKTIYNEDGKPLYVTGASVDITDRKRTEQEIARLNRDLKQRLDELQTLLDVLPVGIAVAHDPECRFITINPVGAAMLGVEPGVNVSKSTPETESLPFKVLRDGKELTPEELPMQYAAAHNVSISGEEYEIIHNDGRVFNLFEYASPLYDEDGNVRGCLGVFVDITDSRQAGEALRESQRMLTTLVGNLPGMAYRCRNDQKRTVEFASGGCMDLTGYPPEDFISGKLTWIQIMHPDDTKRTSDEVQDAISEGKDYELTYRIRTADGKEKWVWEKGTGVFGPDGSLVAIEGFVTDITERKLSEERIQLSLKEKEVLLKEIHHRVKNNLQIISSLLNLQSRTVKGKKALEKFKESQNRVKSMALIHEKLYQSKDLERVDFSEYIRSLLSYLFNSYGVGSRVKLKIEVDEIFMNIDKAIPCGLIINEIVSNSLKHAFPGGDRGEVRVECRENGGSYSLIINNDGIPFPENVDFRKTKSLGLQLVCALVDQLRGSIELVRSGGTEFRIKFGP